jgi:two-component system chemotaxis sensor kinase CheA
MTSDFDVSQYISIFLDEAEEQIQIMDDNILLLEKNNEDVELLNNIFRAAHTIKGSSASMGFEKMAQVTHDLENILEELRQKRLSVSTAIIDLLLESLDAIKVLKQDIAEGKESEIDVAPLIEKLKTFRQIEGTEAISVADAARDKARDEIKSNITFDDIEENLVREVQLRGYNVWQIVVTLVDDCLMKAARAYIVYNNLTDLGEIIKTVPTIEDIEAEKFDKEFQLIIATKEDLDRVENTIKSISEIDSVSVSRVYLDDEVAAAVEDAIDKKMKRSDVESKKIVVGQTVRVDVQRLESLMNLVGELVIDKIRLADIQETLKTKCEAEETVELLDEISLHIGRISTDLQEEIMKARMFPIDQVFNRFPRMVRDLSQKANKEIDFIVEGRETLKLSYF